MNPTFDDARIAIGIQQFMRKIQNDAFKHQKTLQNNVDAAAEYLWTSAKSHSLFKDMTLCSVLNAVIRDDIAAEIEAAATVFRNLNSRRVARVNIGGKAVDTSYPPKGETWRGGSFRRQFRSFFTQGIKYRVPGFLATSRKRHVATHFASMATKTHPCALWRIAFDPRGKDHAEYRVQHMTFVTKTLFRGEGEYLFAPYSVFTLMSVQWSDELRKPHEFVIQPAVDNKKEDENLPLTPWY